MERRALALDYAQRFVGTFYSWGGDDPSGFDCSGFMREVLTAVGALARGEPDMTAAALRQRFAGKETVPRPGALIFRGSPIVHVEMVLAVIGDDVITIGASGGGSKTLTKDDAIKANAFIKLRPWAGPYSACVDPFAGE